MPNPQLTSAARNLEASLPRSSEAFADPQANMLAQRIIGAAAALDTLAADEAVPEHERNTAPPELPDDFPALGSPWTDAAETWRDVAYELAPAAVSPDTGEIVDENLGEVLIRLTEYAATQGVPVVG